MKGTQLELFPPSEHPELFGPEPNPRKIVWRNDPRYQYGGWHWWCIRCCRGGAHYGGPEPDKYRMRYAQTKHRCRLFYTDTLSLDSAQTA